MKGTTMDYQILRKQLIALTENVPYNITNLANASALLYQTLPELNWAGFYLYTDGQLILGPFQGKTACTVIPMGKGVCGTAASEGRTLVVPDVHAFPGHIACDSASRSEIVIPLYIGGRLYGVLDIDSPILDRFSEIDKQGLETFVQTLSQILTQ